MHKDRKNNTSKRILLESSLLTNILMTFIKAITTAGLKKNLSKCAGKLIWIKEISQIFFNTKKEINKTQNLGKNTEYNFLIKVKELFIFVLLNKFSSIFISDKVLLKWDYTFMSAPHCITFLF